MPHVTIGSVAGSVTAACRGGRAMEVQVFGVKRSADTRKALRFFAERRVKVHFVDLTVRAASPGELRRFAERFGVAALVDRDGRRFADLGLSAAHLNAAAWLVKLAAEPLLLRLPLVRCGNRLTVGLADGEWRGWMEAG
jgi:arsenate reductase